MISLLVLKKGAPGALLLPLAFAFGLAGLGFLAPVRQNPKALSAFLGAAAALGAWNAALLWWARRSGRTLTLDVVLKKQHYVQACAQASVLLYWGWYWPPVYAFAPFILAQLIFAYAFDMLLCWSRRYTYALGFGPFPVVFSINLFLWFKPDWFYLQFLMVALGLAAKELIRWNRDGSNQARTGPARPPEPSGALDQPAEPSSVVRASSLEERRVHIFNPSSFPLAVFSLVLLATGSSGITWGANIASTQFYPPHMYLFLFLIGLPGQFFFGVTSMTMSAVVAAYAFGLAYFAATGIYFFYDSYIPIAVFLGMHLLFNDPSTSPRTELGRIVYGALYGLGTVVLYQLLGRAGMPTFYDKLLPVPLLNLSVKGIDGLVRSSARSKVFHEFAPRQRNLAYMFIWTLVFVGLSAAQGVGDNHPGQWLPFWRHACEDGRAYACPYLADLELNFCNRGSGWACNEAGLLHVALARSGEDLRRLDPAGAAEPLRRGCELGFAAACRNLSTLTSGGDSFSAPPPALADFPIVLRGSKGEIRERKPSELYALACREGWPDTCGRAAN
jgi:hypothetical protein